MSADEWDFDPPEREHDCCPRCGRGSCPGAGSLGWDGCEDPVWISVTGSACLDCPADLDAVTTSVGGRSS